MGLRDENNLKVNRVIASCKTRDQAAVAANYVELARKSRFIAGVESIYWEGVLTGVAHANNWRKPDE